MGYLTRTEKDELVDAVYNTIGYTNNVRDILFSEVNKQFVQRLTKDPNDFYQLIADVNKMEEFERLSDGTTPLYLWLERASRLTRPYPQVAVIEKMMAIVEQKSSKSAPIANIKAPSPVAMAGMVKEKVIHEDNMLSFAWLEAGVRSGAGVVRIRVPRYDNGQAKNAANGNPVFYSGTAWLLTKGLVITNHHVIQARDDAEPDPRPDDFQLQGGHAIVDYDFNSESMPGSTEPIASLEAADPKLDYAILRLKVAAAHPPPARMPNPIALPQSGSMVVNIIQHPFGNAKKVAFRDNHVFEVNDPYVRYFTDTEKGSSGSPVFNDRWQVVALHRASEQVTGVNYQGKETGWVNEGIQLRAIFDHLRNNHNALYTEILNG